MQSKRFAIRKPSLHPPIDPENEFQQIELIGKPYLTKQRHHLCKVGSAVHNNHIRLWSYEQWQSKKSDPEMDAWGMPYDVVLVENALGSVCCSGCHSAGINTQSLSDLVVAIEFINTNGELQTVCDYEELKLAQYTIPQGWLNDKATLKSIVANFGLIGVVTSLVLRLDELSYALLQPKRVPILSTIPPKKLDDAPDFFASQKSSSTDLIKAKDNFIKICESDYYAEFFYFPYQQDAIVNTWDNSGSFNDSIPSPIQAHDLEQNVLTYFVYLITPVLSKLLSQEEVAKLFAELTNKVFYQPEQPVCIPITEAMHFQRGVHNIPVTIMEMNIAIPTMDDGSLDWAVAWDIWWRAMTLIYSQAKGKQALQTTMEVRITGGSEVALSPLYGSKACFAIEILGNLQVPKKQWIEFMQSVLNQWLSVRDSQGNPIQVRPHWNKQWRELKFNGLSGIDYMASVYSEQIQLFLAGLERIAMEGGYSTEETQQLFSNPTFDKIIFGNS
ncbi:hypothetical protein JQC92_01950 [Shewanella sp. 202IG2-18]|uniref:D-arabinono-1,4-lactone oxidase n=1 Tax=Parashewanella hymeniacidonis TaxID=2807618 RepID=UPI00195FEBAB|nr:D-arabinono-1,4-lactone oxidase [Parashewanella hymeniacidonis]MBM7070805.1 hypothetical protein [Parashewanella hymeniacidonis]